MVFANLLNKKFKHNKPSDNEGIVVKKLPKKIKLYQLLLAIFLIVQLVLFGIFDLRTVISKSHERQQSNNDLATDNQEIANNFAGILGINIQTDEKLPVLSDNGRTALLIAGIDSREVSIKNGEFVNPLANGTRHIDSIMQIVFDHKTNEVFQISIPRDTGVDIRLDCLHFSGNIHWLYSKGQNSKCKGKGIEVLQAGVESITGIKSQYYVMVSLASFPKIIEAVGEKNDKGEVGIYLENPNGFAEIYPADDNKGWESVYFPKGKLFLTPRRALQFARSRQYSSDFSRAARQQLVVQAVLKRLSDMNVISDPAKIQSMIDLFNNSVLMSKPQDLNELLGMIKVAKLVDVNNIHRMVLDPNFGGGEYEGYLNRPPHDRVGPYYLVPTAWSACPGNEFCKVQERINYYFEHPEELKK